MKFMRANLAWPGRCPTCKALPDRTWRAWWTIHHCEFCEVLWWRIAH